MYEDYDKSSSINTDVSASAIGLGLGLGIGLISTVLSGILFLITRFDILSSSLLALLLYLLTFDKGWNKYVYIIGVIAIFAVSMFLQHLLKVFRIIYGIFTCVVASLFGPAFIGYDSNAKMYLIMAVCFGVTALLGIISWKVHINQE